MVSSLQCGPGWAWAHSPRRGRARERGRPGTRPDSRRTSGPPRACRARKNRAPVRRTDPRRWPAARQRPPHRLESRPAGRYDRCGGVLLPLKTTGNVVESGKGAGDKTRLPGRGEFGSSHDPADQPVEGIVGDWLALALLLAAQGIALGKRREEMGIARLNADPARLLPGAHDEGTSKKHHGTSFGTDGIA
jgi:hypothetical protein